MKSLPAFLAIVLLAGCKPQMGVQPRYQAYQQSDFFPDHSAMRPIPAHTIARGQLDATDSFHTGIQDGLLIAKFPESVNDALLARGREQYEIYCAVCHGFTGRGDGIVVQRGFPAPPTFHSDRLRGAPVGHFFDVITRGYGVMYSYASRVEPADRWAIVAYLRAPLGNKKVMNFLTCTKKYEHLPRESMDKKSSKKASSTPRETFSLDEESQKIISEEQELMKNQGGYSPNRSAVIRKALQLLKAHREQVKKAKVDAEKTGSAKIKKARQNEE